MLACARIGAIHSVVFGGFAAASLATRIDDAKPKVMLIADAGMRGGKVVPYKPLVDEACDRPRPPAKVMIVNRGLDKRLPIVAGRDLDYAALRAQHLDAEVPAPGSNRPSLPTSCTPPAPPASRRACSATPAAMRSRSLRRR